MTQHNQNNETTNKDSYKNGDGQNHDKNKDHNLNEADQAARKAEEAAAKAHEEAAKKHRGENEK